MARILVCGEALFDVFVGAESESGRIALDAAPGGSPFNVAIGLARLGRQAAFFGGLSRDLFGERLAAILTREGVDLAHAARSDAPSTLAIVELLQDRSARYAFRGDGAADRALTNADLPELSEDVKALTFGSFSTIVAPAGDTLLTLAQREAARRVVLYDPNVRPTVEPDLEFWRLRFDAFAETATILKASDEDVKLLAPAASPHDFAGAAHAGGAALAVVTCAGEGVIAAGAFGVVERPTFATHVVDTVGAGDTVTAALLAWLDERDKLARAGIATLTANEAGAMLDFAMRAAALTCSRRGADLPRRVEIA